MSIRVDPASSKITITSAKIFRFFKFLDSLAVLKLGFIKIRICAMWLYSVQSKVSCMFHKQSMDILFTARNVFRTHAFNNILSACTHNSWTAIYRYGEYRKSGYLCGNIIYANYASSCEGA